MLTGRTNDPRRSPTPRLDVYAPLGFDLTEHLGRIAAFNDRTESPTSWRAEIHTGPDFFERMLAERPGNVVVIAGRNAKKIDYILGSVNAGLRRSPRTVTLASCPSASSDGQSQTRRESSLARVSFPIARRAASRASVGECPRAIRSRSIASR